MSVVRCSVCKHEVSDKGLNVMKCTIKKCTVQPNKSRLCKSFEMESSKIRIRKSLPVLNTTTTSEVSYPLTGDLSRFTTTGTNR